jgi:hypothetical protein
MINIIPHGNSGINVFEYKHQLALQVVGVEQAFTELYEDTKNNPIRMIVELGTDYGGLTNLLADHPISDQAEIHTYDINGQRFKSHNSKIQFHCTSFHDAHEEIVSFLSCDKRVLLLCDGGDKKSEFNTYKNFIKSADIIMAHDYAPNREVFIEKYIGKIWNWHEFQDDFAKCNSLEPYLQNIFEDYAWCIRIKK